MTKKERDSANFFQVLLKNYVSKFLFKGFITLDELITPLHQKNNGLSTVFSNTNFITMREHCVLHIFVKNEKYFLVTDFILHKHANTMCIYWC